MSILAVISWLVYASLLVAIGINGIRNKNVALVSFSALLIIVTVARQAMFFAGVAHPHPQEFFDEHEWYLILVANITLMMWVIVFLTSYHFNSGLAHYIKRIFPYRDPSNTTTGRSRGIFLVVIAPFSLSVLGTLFLIQQYGGLSNFTFAVKISKELQGLYIIRIAAGLSSILAFYGVLNSLSFSKNGKLKFSFWTYFYFLITISSMSANFAWGNRYAIALIVLSFMLSWHMYVRKLRIIEILVFGLAAAALLQGLKMLRLGLVSDALGRELSDHSDFWLNISLSLHLVEFDAFMLALRDAGNLFDFRWGKDFVNGLLSWIPRSIYPEKETFQIGGWFRRVYEPEKVNGWPVTTMGDWYINFGFYGIFIGGWISGIFLRAFDMAFREIGSNTWQAAIGPSLAFFIFYGGISTGFPQTIFLYLIPIFLANFFIRLVSNRGNVTTMSNLVSGARTP